MVVMPADHVIRPPEKFQAAIEQAAELVEESPGRIVTFGIRPTYPAEIFGYIHRGASESERARLGRDQLSRAAASKRSRMRRRRPNILASGEYYWNSGIFVWRASTILDALRQRQPEMLKHFEAIVAAWDTPQRAKRCSTASLPRSSRSRSTMR